MSNGENQLTDKLCHEANEIINKVYPTQTHHSSVESTITNSMEEETMSGFYTLDNFKAITFGLNFETIPHLSCNGTTTIKTHQKKEASENLRYHTFNLESKVLKRAKMTSVLMEEVKECYSKILFYDHGYNYKTVFGISNLDRTRAKRQHNAYVSGTNIHPYRHLHKGRTKYTDKIEKEFPFMLHNQATFQLLARSMNNKSNASFPEMSLMMNTYNLYHWFQT